MVRGDRVGGRLERMALPVGGRSDELGRSGLRARAEVGHQGGDVVEILHSTMSSLWISAARPG